MSQPPVCPKHVAGAKHTLSTTFGKPLENGKHDSDISLDIHPTSNTNVAGGHFEVDYLSKRMLDMATEFGNTPPQEDCTPVDTDDEPGEDARTTDQPVKVKISSSNSSLRASAPAIDEILFPEFSSKNDDAEVVGFRTTHSEASSMTSFSRSARTYVLDSEDDDNLRLELEDDGPSDPTVNASATKPSSRARKPLKVASLGQSQPKQHDLLQTVAPFENRRSPVADLAAMVAPFVFSEQDGEGPGGIKEGPGLLPSFKSNAPISITTNLAVDVMEQSTPYSDADMSQYFERSAALPAKPLSKTPVLTPKPAEQDQHTAIDEEVEGDDRSSQADEEEIEANVGRAPNPLSTPIANINRDSEEEVDQSMLETVDLSALADRADNIEEEEEWEKVEVPDGQEHNGTRRKWYKLWRR